MGKDKPRKIFIDKDTILPKDKLSYKYKCKTAGCPGYYYKHRCVNLGR